MWFIPIILLAAGGVYWWHTRAAAAGQQVAAQVPVAPPPPPLPPPAPGMPSSSSSQLAAQAAQAASSTPGGPVAPSNGPFDLSHAGIHLAWQNDHAFISAYQGALHYLAWKFSQPSWDPVVVSGQLDAGTTAAVKAFQTAKKLTPVDGEVGTNTAHAMAAAMVG